MISFKKIALSDREWVEPILQKANFRLAEYTFANNFLWSKAYNVTIAFFDGFFLTKSEDKTAVYGFPVGEGALKNTIDAIINDAAERGKTFYLRAISKENKEILETLYPGKFQFDAQRSSFDYLYNAHDLITLVGKKYQSKRNHVSRFKHTYNWRYEDISSENIAECVLMNAEWCQRYGCDEDDSLKKESCSVKRALENFHELNLIGGLLRVDDKVVAYTVGERLNTDTLIIHIEKAFHEFNGAYQAINQLFASKYAVGYKYINREDDVGNEGLRKAKLSYHPVELIEKYVATINQ